MGTPESLVAKHKAYTSTAGLKKTAGVRSARHRGKKHPLAKQTPRGGTQGFSHLRKVGNSLRKGRTCRSRCLVPHRNIRPRTASPCTPCRRWCRSTKRRSCNKHTREASGSPREYVTKAWARQNSVIFAKRHRRPTYGNKAFGYIP